MFKQSTALTLCLLIGASTALAQDRSQSRSMVSSPNGVVASESVLASQVGARILEQGGNAIDAAVAVNAMMGLVAPMNDGIGGDLFAIIYEAKSGKLYGLNASGWAPAGLSADYLLAKGITAMPTRGIQSVTVPGAVNGWGKLLSRFGRKNFAAVLAPAIDYAEAGFAVGEVVSVYWKDSENDLRADEPTAKTYLRPSAICHPPSAIRPQPSALCPPAAGDLFRNPDLAWTYREIARGGAAGFYKGAVAQMIVATSSSHGGTMTAADLAEYESEWVDPISTTYRGWTVYEMPPNGQGIAALEMLNIMETFPLASLVHNSTRALHLMIEAKKLAYADMQRYDADPRFAKIPVAAMRSKEYAAGRARLIDAERASCSVSAGAPPGTDNGTTYLSVVDRDGNMVSLIQSNYSTVGFGSGIAVGGAGFALHNRGGGFTLDKTSPNVLAGRKRPLHTIIPAFMEKGDVRIAFGIMGGWNQAQAHAQFVSNVADFGMNVQAAIDAPRFSKETFAGCDVNLEARIPEATRKELAAQGHQVVMRGDYSSTRMGSGQAVRRDFTTGMNSGASDPRKDGAAVQELLPAGATRPDRPSASARTAAPAAAPAAAPRTPAAPYEVYAVRYGTIERFPAASIVAGADTARRLDLALMVWLARLPGGRNVLMDAGFYRSKFVDRWKPVQYERPSAALARLGLQPEDVTDIIISHVHWDHVDGADLFPRARVWIQREEYEHYVDSAGRPRSATIDSADAAMLAGLTRAGRVELIAGDSVEILPGIRVFTGGKHTYASQYATVETAAGAVVLASDNAYLYENLERRRPIAQTLDSLSNLRAQERMGRLARSPAFIVPGHDAAVFARFPLPGSGVARIQ
jgi:gamma-glutamyltranspeptidase/glutathione hydrolase